MGLSENRILHSIHWLINANHHYPHCKSLKLYLIFSHTQIASGKLTYRSHGPFSSLIYPLKMLISIVCCKRLPEGNLQDFP